MKHDKNHYKKAALLLLVGLALGPELYIFAPEILLFFQAAGMEYLIGSAIIVMTSVRAYIMVWLRMIFENERFRKYVMVVPFAIIVSFMPEMIILMDVGIASTFLLINFRPNWLTFKF